MKTIYLFSGLGADYRAFQNLELDGFHKQFIVWEVPLANESLTAYAQRLLNQITSDKPILIGLSFGGIVATEVANLIPAEQVILISSVATRSELPFYFRHAGIVGLHRLIPFLQLVKFQRLNNWLFGVKSESDKKVLSAIIADTQPDFLLWAIDIIVRWKNNTRLSNIVQLHGTADKLFPMYCNNAGIRIPGGGHFMVLNKAFEINVHLRSILNP
ncbi:MAG: alpha/beta hydrolase [Chitinophagales bacterium]|nr:alpha/beta hydrolase [Chitinophagales bacterium]